MKEVVGSNQNSLREQGLLPLRRTVVATRLLAAPHGEVARAARVWLAQLVASALPWRRSLPYDLVAVVTPRRLRRLFQVPVDLDISSPTGHGVVAHLHWRAHRRAWLFPAMDADLVARPTSGGCTEVALVGTYRPPFGIVGVVGDVLVGRSVARSTAAAFVEQVGDALEQAVQEGRCSAEQFQGARGAA